jgi:ssDNA-specific exonuclease RecJ
MKNQERVWKAEQQDAAEKRKVVELENEIKNERSREELKDIARKSGIINTSDPSKKLEWMYKETKVNREEYLLGRSIDKTYEQQVQSQDQDAAAAAAAKNHVEHECIPFSIRQYKGFENHEQVDISRKLMEDPLMLIQQKELDSRRKLLENPVKLKELHKLLKEEKVKKIYCVIQASFYNFLIFFDRRQHRK